MRAAIRSSPVAIGYWVRGVRFYIACATLLITVEIWWWAAVSYPGSILFATRMEEAYAWLAVILLGLALAIGPAYKVFPQLPGGSPMRDARRLVGVSAAWFSVLHVTIAYVSLFKLANPYSLPIAYEQSFLIGLLALLILLAMAFTSFDKAFHGMGVWWFRLHRLAYAVVLLILLHAFMIGTHAAHWPALIALTAGVAAVLILHIYLAFFRQRRPTAWQLLTIGCMVVLLVALFNYGYSQELGYSPIGGRQHQRI